MTTTPSITSLKSNKSIILKKTLIIGAAVAGLLLAGALAFAATQTPEVLELDPEI